jgi:hypothetical protein
LAAAAGGPTDLDSADNMATVAAAWQTISNRRIPINPAMFGVVMTIVADRVREPSPPAARGLRVLPSSLYVLSDPKQKGYPSAVLQASTSVEAAPTASPRGDYRCSDSSVPAEASRRSDNLCLGGGEIILPQKAAVARHCGRLLLEASVAPFALFYTSLRLVGLRPALAAVLVLHLCLITRRLKRAETVPFMVVLSGILVIERTLTVFLTRSIFLYFAQPALGTLAVGLGFAISALAGRPLVERLVQDFFPLPVGFRGYPGVSHCFATVSMLFAVVYLINAGGTVFLLTQSSLGSFLVLKSVLSPLVMAVAVALSYLLFRRTLRVNQIVLRWTATA